MTENTKEIARLQAEIRKLEKSLSKIQGEYRDKLEIYCVYFLCIVITSFFFHYIAGIISIIIFCIVFVKILSKPLAKKMVEINKLKKKIGELESKIKEIKIQLEKKEIPMEKMKTIILKENNKIRKDLKFNIIDAVNVHENAIYIVLEALKYYEEPLEIDQKVKEQILMKKKEIFELLRNKKLLETYKVLKLKNNLYALMILEANYLLSFTKEEEYSNEIPGFWGLIFIEDSNEEIIKLFWFFCTLRGFLESDLDYYDYILDDYDFINIMHDNYDLIIRSEEFEFEDILFLEYMPLGQTTFVSLKLKEKYEELSFLRDLRRPF
ncbi:MAG: hypothetical protein ACTSUX_08755 [Promethearchaeota archaeon]